MSRIKTELDNHSDNLRNEGRRLQQSSAQEVEVTVANLEQEVADFLKKMQKKLPNMIKDYGNETNQENGEGSYFPDQMDEYLKLLCGNLDSAIEQDLDELFDRTLAKKYETTREHLISNYQALLGMPRDSMHHLYQLMTPPTFSLSFKCAEICQDFVPDVKFNFLRSFGVSGRWLKDTLNLESVLGRLYSQTSQILSFMKMEYVIPVYMLGASLMLPRLFNWRVVVVSLGVFGSLYTWKWSTFNHKVEYHKQFSQHVAFKMRERASVSSKSYRDQVGNSLKLLLDGLQQEVDKVEQETERKVGVLTTDISRCTLLQQTARTLKNGAHLLRNDFHQFKDSHLSDAA